MADRNVKVVRNNGRHAVLKAYGKSASTPFDKNSLCEFASGVMNPSDDNDTVVAAIIQEEIASTDSDYTSATAKKTFQLLFSDTEVEMDTTSTATVGTAYGISNAYTVDVSDTTNKVATCTRVISSTRAVFTFKTYFGGANAL